MPALDLNAARQGGEQLRLRGFMTPSDAVRTFRERLLAKGYEVDALVGDGSIQRITAPGDKPGQKSGWYVLHLDHLPVGSFGNWREEESETFIGTVENRRTQTSEIIRTWTDAEKAELDAVMARIRHERERERNRIADQAAQNAERIWEAAGEASKNAYLARKGVEAFGVREDAEGVLLVPMINAAGQLRGVQRIFADGQKRFLFGCEKKGCFHWIAGDSDTIYICEGYSTGASLHMATGASIVAAMDCGNLLPAAQKVRDAMPQAQIVIAADNDQWTKKKGIAFNPGMEAAHKAAAEVRACVVYPEFKDVSGNPTDFNDLHQREGLEAVRLQALVSGSGPRITDWGIDLFTGKAPEVKWLVRGLLPLAAPCLLAASGGTGKGMLALDLALSAAGQASLISLNEENRWLGHDVCGHGSVVILSAEDSRDSIHQRLDALDPDGKRRHAAKGKLYIVPLPNAGGPIQLVTSNGYGKGFSETEVFTQLKRQLRRIPNLRLISIDPLASFVGVDVNTDPQAGQFTMGLLANLAEETGACILTAHHMGKGGKEKFSAETARASIRGTTALVDGVRLALAVWQAGGDTVKAVEKGLKHPVKHSAVFEFAVVKSNAPADMDKHVLLRDKNGLLKCVDAAMAVLNTNETKLSDLLVNSVRTAAINGRPFTRRGLSAGLYGRREELPEALRILPKNRLEALAQSMLEEERIVGCTYGSSPAKFLDVPDGDFAKGLGEINAAWIGAKTDNEP